MSNEDKWKKTSSSPVNRHSVHTLVFRSLKRTHEMFASQAQEIPPLDPELELKRRRLKARDLYPEVKDKVDAMIEKKKEQVEDMEVDSQDCSSSLAIADPSRMDVCLVNLQEKHKTVMQPKWHPPWKLYRVISGHLGWVRCCSVDPKNILFATGGTDNMIKIWDLASGHLKLSLTGHISSVRGLAFSARHPYLFSAGEDKQVKCWDLETNKVVRHYHGHLSAVYSLTLHPTIEILITAGRDCTARVWDMRTRANVHVLSGHTNTVSSVISQVYDPQIITGSHDSTVRLWDLAAGKSMITLTHHKKSVRCLAFHPKLHMFASASPDNIKQWRSENGKFIQNLTGHQAIINCMAINEDGVFVSGADNGSMCLWDWRTGYNFQRVQTKVQPGSMDSEAGIFSLTFDKSGSRLISTEADKTIKIYKEDAEASEETHPIKWKPSLKKTKM